MDLSTPPPVVKFQQPSPEARSIRAFLLRRAGIPVDDLVPFLPSMTRCSFIYVPGSRHNNCSPDYSFTPCPPKPTIPSLPLRHPHKHGGIRFSHGDHTQHRGEGKGQGTNAGHLLRYAVHQTSPVLDSLFFSIPRRSLVPSRGAD